MGVYEMDDGLYDKRPLHNARRNISFAVLFV